MACLVIDGRMLSAADSLTHAVRSLRTTLCVRFKSETVACGIIFMAARRCKVCIPDLLLPAISGIEVPAQHAFLERCRIFCTVDICSAASSAARYTGHQLSEVQLACSLLNALINRMCRCQTQQLTIQADRHTGARS